MVIFKNLLLLLDSKERKNASLLIIMIIIMALLDMIGVASILPFIAVLTNQSLIETNIILNTLFKSSSFFGVSNYQHFLFFLGILVFILLITSLTFKALTHYFQNKFIKLRGYSIGKRLIEGYLHQPYSWFLNRHSADLGKNILSEVDQVVDYGINSLFELIAKGMVTIALLSLILIIEPLITLAVGLTLGFSYSLIFYFVRNYLSKTGKQRLKNNQRRFTFVSEAFTGIKEVKVAGLEKTYINNFSNSANIFARTQASAEVISVLPRYLLEAVAFGGIILIILYMMSKTGNFDNILPIISLYVFVGYRLMPSLQMMYMSLSNLTFVTSSIKKLSDDVKYLKYDNASENQIVLSFKNKIEVKNVVYSYPNSSRVAIKNVNLFVDAGSTIGIIGATGSGKTTIVDIILGLLEPQSGKLIIDGNKLTKKNIKSWQRSIGYVPQHIYLSDDTVSSNIAFGEEPHNIKQDLVEQCAKISNIHDFVMNELPQNYKTFIGERGIRLSGGERQRIGIARALYRNPKLLILDEATSALDNQTEENVMTSIYKLGKEVTIIIIAHRLKTIQNCDEIFLFDDGELKLKGKFEMLKKNIKL